MCNKFNATIKCNNSNKVHSNPYEKNPLQESISSANNQEKCALYIGTHCRKNAHANKVMLSLSH